MENSYVTPRLLPLREFPASQKQSEGMITLPADFSGRQCHVYLNIPYAEKSGMTLHLHMLVPEITEEEQGLTFPLILFVQGSAWMKQDLGNNLGNLPLMARRGFVIGMVEYRPSEAAPFPAQTCDAKTALRWLLQHAEEYRIDPERVYVWGDSSGGHTAVMTALTQHDLTLSDEKEDNLRIRACVDYYGPMMMSAMNEELSILDHMGADSPEGLLIGKVRVDENPEKALAASPVSYIRPEADIPPMLIIHGSRDRIVPFGQSCLLYDALKRCGKEAVFYRLEGADHGGAPFFSPEVLAIVENFLRSH